MKPSIEMLGYSHRVPPGRTSRHCFAFTPTMPHSYARALDHVVYSTKERRKQVEG